MKKETLANVAAITSAVIWGIFFLIAKISLLDLSLFNVITYRYLFASIPFIILIIVKSEFPKKQTIIKGMILGAILFTADFFQLAGIQSTTVSSSALLSQGSILFIPLILFFILKSEVEIFDFLRATLALIGIYLFIVKESIGTISKGDLLILVFAIVISIYFIVNERFVKKEKLTHLLAIQFFTGGVLGIIFSLSLGELETPLNFASWAPLLYLGLISGALAWGLNSWAQTRIKSHRIVVIYVLEPLVAGILAFIFFSEQIGIKEFIGAVLILFAVVMPIFRKKAF